MTQSTNPPPFSPSRRQFLIAAGVSAATAACVATVANVADTAPPLVDTHLHCFAGANDTRFPYHANAPYRPEAPATPEHLLRCMDDAGVNYAVVVHPEPYQDDHRYLEHCLAVGKRRLKGVCLFFADRPDAMKEMTALAKRVPLGAARVHAYAPERLPPFDAPEMRALWKQATDLGLAIQLHFEPRYAPRFEGLIRDFSKTTVLIDHLGRPFQGTPDEYEKVLAFSRFKNVVMKYSSIPPTTQYPHRDITTTIKRLTEAYGPDRMLYGGGFDASATGKSYKAAFDNARKYIAHLSEADQAKIMGGNAVRLFGFGG